VYYKADFHQIISCIHIKCFVCTNPYYLFLLMLLFIANNLQIRNETIYLEKYWWNSNFLFNTLYYTLKLLNWGSCLMVFCYYYTNIKEN